MAKTLALLFRVVLLLIGILGFLPATAPNGNPARNVEHLLTAIVASCHAWPVWGCLATVVKIFGVFYGLLAVLSFVVGNGMLSGLINNEPGTWLRVRIAAARLSSASRGLTS